MSICKYRPNPCLTGILLKILTLEILNFSKNVCIMESHDQKCVKLLHNSYQNMHMNFVDIFVST